MLFQQVTNEFYLDKERTTLDMNKLGELRKVLKTVNSNELKTLEDHRDYLNLLGKFRKAIATVEGYNGDNYREMRDAALSVGPNSIYTNDLHFIYELIQNADDCIYMNPDDCKLDMHFDDNPDQGKIILKYNEKGFTPENVFAITGIGERSKNTSDDKIEIGEKGLGFKSVFGVADKVLIQSGKFSFLLRNEERTVPIAHYDGFNGMQGTTITLFLPNKEQSESCKSIYDRLVGKFSEPDALVNENPSLFLNKLTKIRIYLDSFDSVEFSVSRPNKKDQLENGLYREKNVIISAEIISRKDTERKSAKIICTRYTMPIEYNREMCQSRYDVDTTLEKKKMELQILIPNPEYFSEISCGTLYSFLPTRVKTSVPISCHIPFKLNDSREYVDSQNKNAWFIHSVDTFADMLHYVYADYAKIVKNKILYYVPFFGECFFKTDNENDKLGCLKRDSLKGAAFLQDPIIYTEEGHFKNHEEVFSFDESNGTIDDPKTLCRLLNQKKELFIQPPKCNAKKYEINVLKNPYQELFSHALKKQAPLKESLDLLDAANATYRDLILGSAVENLTFDMVMVNEILRHSNCFEAFNDLSIKRIKSNGLLKKELQVSSDVKDIHFIISRDEPIDEQDLDYNRNRHKSLTKYIHAIHYRYITADFNEDQYYFIFQNILVLSSSNTLAAFAKFCQVIGGNDYFAARIMMRSASIELNKAENMKPIPEFMKLLYEVRCHIKDILNESGKNGYANYIKAIRTLNADPQRFIRELIQNADDCEYAEGKRPYFKMTIDGTNITTEYNEIGFKKENVRAITAIGESTKKQLQEGNYEIGEKGIGFKTVFAVADKVDIHSKKIHFRLKAETPTIPEEIPPIEGNKKGTKMLFSLRKPLAELANNISSNYVLSLCLCLRKLKDVNINGIQISIDDTEYKRIINIDDKQYTFDIYRHSFNVDDEEALKERCEGGKHISSNQEIVYYVPEQSIPDFTYYLHCGLPTAIEIGVPFVIDVPFELTASRDEVVEGSGSRWNEILKREMYIAYAKVLEKISRKSRIDVLNYVRFLSSRYGSEVKFCLFKNDGNSWINKYNLFENLKSCRFIPTYNKDLFVTPLDKPYNCPNIVHSMIDKSKLTESEQNKIIDDPESNSKNNNESKLKNLGCRQLPYLEIIKIICERAHLYIHDKKFRNNLYDYLANTEDIHISEYQSQLKNAKLIPIKGRHSSKETSYVSFNEMDIYVDELADFSPDEYGILDTSIISRARLVIILGEDIKSMDDVYRKHLYENKLKKMICSDGTREDRYKCLINELKINGAQFRTCKGTLLEYKYRIPFLMEDKSYQYPDHVFYTTLESGHFHGRLIKSYVAVKEASQLAGLLNCKDIEDLSYDDLEIISDLTADDIEDLQDSNENNGKRTIHKGYSILEQCISNGQIPVKLIDRYNLEGIKKSDYSEMYDKSNFPNEPVKNYCRLRSKILDESKKDREIHGFPEERIVYKTRYPNNKVKGIDTADIRERTLKRYNVRDASLISNGSTDRCFCQMCQSVKSKDYMEVNNICLRPQYYWPQMRISLCLECSKKFEKLRNNEYVLKQFYDAIKNADVFSNEPISIPIGNEEIHFTQTHLAEIQEIFKTGKGE